ncbi:MULTISPECIES: hypothetical protein [unclassified Rathayibacter]|nr:MULTISPECIES: hypothetical protein [unclassified Rathayibacter]
MSASGSDGDRAALRAAWQEYRALPADARPRAWGSWPDGAAVDPGRA